MKEWVETWDGTLVEVEVGEEHEDYYLGRKIDENDFKLRYGESIKVKPEDIKDDGTEDDLSVVFQNMNACVNEFFGKAEKMFEEERDFYGT